MRSDHGISTIVWIAILLVPASAVVFLAVDRCARDANLEAAQDALAKLETKIREEPEKTKTTIHELTTRLDQTRVQFEKERLQSKAALENEQKLSARLETFSKELQARKQDHQRLNASLTELQSSVRPLVQALKQAETDQERYEKRVADAEKKVRQFEKQAQTLKRKATELARTNQELGNELDYYKNLYELAVEIVDDWGAVSHQLDLTCTVQSVNTKYKYLMLSVGRDDKVFRGNRFTISRNGQYVGEVQVDYVYPKSCSASFVRLMDYMAFQPGDQASTRP